MQRTPNSLDYDHSVIEIMDQIDQMFQLLEKNSEENLGYEPNDGESSRWVSKLILGIRSLIG